MSKPVSGTAINTSDSQGLATGLVACWAMLEGSGSTSADLVAGTYNLTLDGTVSWGTDNNGDACLNFAGSPATPYEPASLASTLTLTGGSTNDWSIAWRGKQTSSGNAGMLLGDIPATNYIWLSGGNYLEVYGTGLHDFTGVTSFTTNDDWLLSYVH